MTSEVGKFAGLTEKLAKRKLRIYGLNLLEKRKKSAFSLLFKQFFNPLILLLISCSILSFFLKNPIDAAIIALIVFLSGLISFFQERGAIKSVEALIKQVGITATVERDQIIKEIPKELIAPGDLIHLKAGDLIPADAVVIEANHLYLDEAVVTGESVPQEKFAINSLEKNHVTKKERLFTGTMVISGIGKAIITQTGKNTEFGHLIQKIRLKTNTTSFEQKLKGFSYILLDITLVIVLTIFILNIYLKKPILDAFLFSLALSVGLVPQLLPAIIGVNLAYGAKKLSAKSVIIKFLPSLENFGLMNVLCTDKTGTITTGKMSLKSILDIDNQYFEKAEKLIFLNSHFQSSYKNPIDEAILFSMNFVVDGYKKVDEIPYDFQRKRISISIQNSDGIITITKGAFKEVLPLCKYIELSDGNIKDIKAYEDKILQDFDEATLHGNKVLVACYKLGLEEKDMIFLGLLKFHDPIKPTAKDEIERLKKQGIKTKIITGDHRNVAREIAETLNLSSFEILTGKDMVHMDDRALIQQVQEKSIFAEIEPNQKERIVLALKKAGHTVGYLGDGINDVPAIFSSDVGIATDTSTDAAKDSADIILLKNDLTVISDGVDLGRKCFENVLKYLQMASSANFGNMLSMAIISLFLPFLPLLPKQILLLNFLSDFPEMSLATDYVDKETTKNPSIFKLAKLKNFMIIFGIISSVADFATFFVLSFLQVNRSTFQTAWFVESILSAVLAVLCLRTKKFFLFSKPSKLLFSLCIVICALALILPYLEASKFLGLVGLNFKIYTLIFVIVLGYLVMIELTKFFYYRKWMKK